MTALLPPSLSPAVIARHRHVDLATRVAEPDAELDGLVSAVAHAHAQATSLLALRASLDADLSRTPTDRALVLADRAPAIVGRGAEAIDRAIARAEDGAAKLARRISAPDPVPGMAVDAEVRTRLAALKTPAARRDALAQAIADGEDAVIGAALRAPAMLSGIDPATLEHLRGAWQAKARPAELDRLRRLRAAISETQIAGRALVAVSDGFTRAPGLDVAMQRRAAADAAIAASRV